MSLAMWNALALVVLCATPPYGLTGGEPPAPGGQTRPRPRGNPLVQPRDDADRCGAAARPADRSCATDADCVVVRQQVSCCGTVTVLGINRADAERFQAQERRCAARGPACLCAPGPTTVDDGSRLEGNANALVACRARRCTTFLAPRPEPRPQQQAGRPRLTSESIKALPRCQPSECGPAPMYPSMICPDGVSIGGRGPCVRLDGRCGWAHLECP